MRANLDVRAYFSSACPPPASAPTLYALCWLLELHPANSTRACERAAAKGPLPQFEARYRSYTKSAFDGRWRLVDVCNRDKRVALFGPDDKQSYTSRWIRCLLYCRLHGPLQPKSEARRPRLSASRRWVRSTICLGATVTELESSAWPCFILCLFLRRLYVRRDLLSSYSVTQV